MKKEKVMKTIANGEYTYYLTRKWYDNGEGESAYVYGIRISAKDETAFVDDISDDLDRISGLFLLVSEEELCPGHLIEIAEDAVSLWSEETACSICEKY